MKVRGVIVYYILLPTIKVPPPKFPWNWLLTVSYMPGVPLYMQGIRFLTHTLFANIVQAYILPEWVYPKAPSLPRLHANKYGLRAVEVEGA